VAGNLDQTAQMHGIADVLFAYGICPRIQLLKARGPALAQPLEKIGLGQCGHTQILIRHFLNKHIAFAAANLIQHRQSAGNLLSIHLLQFDRDELLAG
jgi:hypothetical protein